MKSEVEKSDEIMRSTARAIREMRQDAESRGDSRHPRYGHLGQKAWEDRDRQLKNTRKK